MPSKVFGCQSQWPSLNLCMVGVQTLLEIGDRGNVRIELQGDLGTIVVIILTCSQSKILVVHKTLDVMDIIA